MAPKRLGGHSRGIFQKKSKQELGIYRGEHIGAETFSRSKDGCDLLKAANLLCLAGNGLSWGTAVNGISWGTDYYLETHLSNLTAKTMLVYARHRMVVTTAPLASMSIRRRRGRQSRNHTRNSSARIILREARRTLRRERAEYVTSVRKVGPSSVAQRKAYLLEGE